MARINNPTNQSTPSQTILIQSVTPFATAIGPGALSSLSATGVDNTAVGYEALQKMTTGQQNTAFGAFAQQANTIATQNTAIGYNAMLSATTGSSNTAMGSGAMQVVTVGTSNVGVGFQALYSGTSSTSSTVAVGPFALQTNTGSLCVAVGAYAMESNQGNNNVAIGNQALAVCTTGANNVAVGSFALGNNNTSSNNTALGANALFDMQAGGSNVAVGYGALDDISSASNNTAAGGQSGVSLSNGSNNVLLGSNAGFNYAGAEMTNLTLGANVSAIVGDINAIRIGTSATGVYITGIAGVTVSGGTQVYVTSAGVLGTVNSSIRFKEAVEDMKEQSAPVLALNPVRFHYKKDGLKAKQYGLIAEEVERIFPSLVVYDPDGQPGSVQYHILPALLLNEVQKLRKIQQRLEKDNETLLSRMKKIETRIKKNKKK